MPALAIPASTDKPVLLPVAPSSRILHLRNKATADSGKRVYYAFSQKECVPGSCAYLEPGEALPMIGHSSDIGARSMYFQCAGSDTSAILYSQA